MQADGQVPMLNVLSRASGCGLQLRYFWTVGFVIFEIALIVIVSAAERYGHGHRVCVLRVCVFAAADEA